MLDVKFICENPELVKENIRKKFKDSKLPLVDEAVSLYTRKCAANTRAGELRANRNRLSKEIGMLMSKGQRAQAEEKKRSSTVRQRNWPVWKRRKRSLKRSCATY